MPTAPTWVLQQRDAEVIREPSLWLLADSSHTGGALGANRLYLKAGAAGARPHYHRRSSEAFYVLDGKLQMLVDNDIVTIDKGGYVVIPPCVHHAFAAAPDTAADLLITLVPGVERFQYFRLLPQILRGELRKEEIAQIHERYDVHFVDSLCWDNACAARSSAAASLPSL